MFAITSGNVADIRMARDLLARSGPCRSLIADRAYDADALRGWLATQGIKSVIPGRRNRKIPIRHDQKHYRERWRVEATIGRLKDFRRVATRYDKLARTFRDAVTLAAITAFWV